MSNAKAECERTEKIISPTTESVANYLANLARNRKTITYSDLLLAFDLPPITQNYRWRQSPMPKAFGLLDAYDIHNRLPLRTSVVVQKSKVKTKSPVPGNGYFKTLCHYRETPLPQSIDEKRKAHNEELVRLHRAYDINLD